MSSEWDQGSHVSKAGPFDFAQGGAMGQPIIRTRKMNKLQNFV